MSSNSTSSPPRILIIGAGGRGKDYARPIRDLSTGIIAAVAEPNKFKREFLGHKYIWGSSGPSEGQEFAGWEEFLQYELDRRARAARGEVVPEGVDAAFICTLDAQHKEIIDALAPLKLHLMSEKPLATSLDDCIGIYKSLLKNKEAPSLFAIGHVLRYSPHNRMLHKLVVEEQIIGEVLCMEHTEPVGWWHFAHSYVRGNWRKESTTAPTLLTKSCHDIDFLLWMLCSPQPLSSKPAHLPTTITSSGSLVHFKPSRKPSGAGAATNCLSCPVERSCLYSAKKIYHDAALGGEAFSRPWYSVKVVAEIEDCIPTNDIDRARKLVLPALLEDYDSKTPQKTIDERPWYGRCVYEAANDVCDDQVVVIDWNDDPLTESVLNHEQAMIGRSAKKAIFHMVAWTERVCERRSRIYSAEGEIETDGETITVWDFATNTKKTYHPEVGLGHHGGGDDGLALSFVNAVDAVKRGGMSVEEAQMRHIGCSVEEVIRSHAMVFAADEARKEGRIIDWGTWWEENVEKKVTSLK